MSWSAKYPSTSYNSWLREEAQNSNTTLKKNMAKLQQVLPVLESVICPAEITSERLGRVSQAINHLIVEIHLLVTLTEEKV